MRVRLRLLVVYSVGGTLPPITVRVAKHEVDKFATFTLGSEHWII